MKRLVTRATFVLVVGALTIATGALAQLASDAAAVKARASFAHIAVSRRSIAFGKVKQIETKSITIRNTGNIAANVTVVAPPSPFGITAGGGSYTLAPKQPPQIISVQFAPTAAGAVKQEMTIQCSNCNTAADDNVVIHLSGNAKAPVATPTSTAAMGANALPFSVTAGPFQGAVDEPFASITICATGTSNCTTVNDVLIDTASFGLRIFGSQISGLGITPNTDGASEIGECAFFGSGSTWGAVSTVDVKMAGEPTITIPIQVIDDTNAFARPPSDCTMGTQLMSSPSEAQLNGLIGVGQGSNDTIFAEYFECSGGNCSTQNNPPNQDIVVNPVSSLPVDNNGVVVSLPSIPAGGQATTDGTLYFGIGTESNNNPGTVKTYDEDSNPNDINNYLEINTVFKGQTAGGLFDTGSNGFFFNDSSISQCSAQDAGFYCPTGTLSESATNQSVDSPVSGVVSFSVANAANLFKSNNASLDDLGGINDGMGTYDGFDWGLPFFFGRTVFLGIDGTSSPLGPGPYIAY